MAEKRRKTTRSTSSHRRKSTSAPPKRRPKVGSSPSAARQFAGKGDFGVPETGNERDRQYVSRETKINDPGGMVPHSIGRDVRESGVGGNASGAGSSSGGDVDTDVVGVGSGGSGLAQSGPDRSDGPDVVQDDQSVSDTFASKSPPRSRNAKVDPPDPNRRAPRSARRETVKGSTVDRTGGDVSTTDPGQGPGAVTNPSARDDDSFAGEINIDEASGIDNSPSDG